MLLHVVAARFDQEARRGSLVESRWRSGDAGVTNSWSHESPFSADTANRVLPGDTSVASKIDHRLLTLADERHVVGASGGICDRGATVGGNADRGRISHVSAVDPHRTIRVA